MRYSAGFMCLLSRSVASLPRLRRRTAPAGRSWGYGSLLSATLLILGLAPARLLAQANATGTITGQVVDQSGAVIAGAQVTVTDTATKSYRSQPTNSAGRFVFTNLPPGAYEVKVTKSGFRQWLVTNQKVVVGGSIMLNVTLEVGAATQTVEVTATPGAELQTLNATMGTTVGGDTLLALPNQNRDATSLILFQPTAIPTFGGAEGNITGGQVAGSMSDQNTFTLDGGNATDDLAGDNNYVAGNRGYVGPQAAIPTPVESIEEFKVATNNQTADFSTSAGAEVMLVTKRGTNTFHGSAYDYFQADWLDAAGWNANVRGAHKVKQHQNRVGGSLGGPLLPGQILGGRTYIYGNYEGRRYPYSNSTFEKTVPSDLLRQGILQFRDATGNIVQYNLRTSTQCGPAGNLPCDPRGIGLNPIIGQLWNTYEPEPNDCARGGDHLNTCGYFAPLKLPIRDDFVVARLDHDFGPKWRFMGSYRFYRLDYPSTNQVDIGGLIKGDKKGVPTSHSSNPAQPRYVVAGLTGTITPTLTNEFHVSYLRDDWNWIRYGVPTGVFGVPGGLEVGGETNDPLAPMAFDTQNARFRTWNGHDWTYADSVTWLKGNHLFQLGGSAFHWWDNHVRPDNVTGSLTQLVYQINKGSGLKMTADFQPPHCSATLTTNCIPTNRLGSWNALYAETLGFIGQAQQLFVRGGNDFHLTGAPYLEDHSITVGYSLYFTDSYKVKPSVTVNYGLEWGVEMPPYELNGVQDYLTDAAGNPVRFNAYMDNRRAAALKGQVYNPVLGFEPIRAVGGHPKYPFQPFYGAFSPRVSIAWNPSFDSGVLGKLLGNKKSVIRGGYGRIYDRANAVNLVLTPLLGYGFGQPVRCRGAGIDGQCHGNNGTDPTNGFRIGVDGLTAPFPAVSPTLPIPAEPGVNSPAASVLFGLDNQYRPGSDDQIDLSIQRELPGQIILEAGYTGRWARHLYLGTDTNNVPYMLKLGGQTFAQAYYALWQADHAGTAASPQPFFETALGGSSYCTGFPNCTAAVLANEGAAGTSNITTEAAYAVFADLDGHWNFPGCAGCAILPETLQNYAALNQATTNGFANYQAGILSLQKRAGQGLTLIGNLTWSHSLNTIGINQEYVEAAPNDNFNLNTDYGPAPWDRTWVLNLLADYELPFGSGKKFSTTNRVLDRVIGGWSFAPLFTWATGIPIETYTGSCQEFGEGNIGWCAGAVPLKNTGAFGHSPHMAVKTDCNVGVNNDPSCPGGGGTGGNLFANPTAVYNSYRPALLGLDTSAYDLGPYHGQSRWNLDFTLAKQTKITERVGATAYAQFLNALNHMEYGDPGMNLQDPANFGTLTGQYNNPRVIELGLRIFF